MALPAALVQTKLEWSEEEPQYFTVYGNNTGNDRAYAHRATLLLQVSEGRVLPLPRTRDRSLRVRGA